MRHSKSNNVTVLSDEDPCEKCCHASLCSENKLACLAMFNWIRSPTSKFNWVVDYNRVPSDKYYE